MRTVILRSSQSEGEIHKQIQSVVSEEKLREIRSCAGSILSRLLTGDKQIEFVNELKDMSTSQRIDIIEAKRSIADELIKKGEYIF